MSMVSEKTLLVLSMIASVMMACKNRMQDSPTLSADSVDAADAGTGPSGYAQCIDEPRKFVMGVEKGRAAQQQCTPELKAAGCIDRPSTYRYQLLLDSGVYITLDRYPNGTLERTETGYSVPGATMAWKHKKPCNCSVDPGCTKTMFEGLIY